MTDVYLWRCICGASGKGEIPAQRHAKTCHTFGWPNTNPYVDEQRAKP
jgi:hypothetical protein